ncbi:MAG: hypothetical protein HC900_03840 [Methylacidiphilales bacterium]|nr:hypothetical protein [Candidatus Methylacidiphilales bacterium]
MLGSIRFGSAAPAGSPSAGTPAAVTGRCAITVGRAASVIWTIRSTTSRPARSCLSISAVKRSASRIRSPRLVSHSRTVTLSPAMARSALSVTVISSAMVCLSARSSPRRRVSRRLRRTQ